MAKTSKSSSAKKSAAKAKAPPPKSAAKKPAPAKKAEPKDTKKPAAHKPIAKKPEPASKPAAKPTASAGKAPAATAAASAANGSKPPAKGITIVPSKPMKRPKPKKLEMPISEPLLKPGGPKWKPLIPSGPKAPPTGIVGAESGDHSAEVSSKARLSKKELERYREILLQKRAELAGDINNIEDEALRQNSGSLSSLPQHMAEQGSDTFEQSISLDLAQVDRNLIREIDDALKRIEDGTYGVCPRTGQRISPERLAELPWAKYSIEAQREMERRPYFHRGE